jgi:N-acetylmuramoyl-L-alanine amidase
MRWIEVAGAVAMAAAVGMEQSPPAAQTSQPNQAPPPASAQQLPQSPAVPSMPAPLPSPAQGPRFLVVVDAAHGGSDIGARIGDGVLEKDITLGIAARLRSTLHARGIDVVTTRTGDVNLPAVNRAETANHAQGAACLTIHATATGSGVHLYTSSLTPTANTRFMPWQTAQSAYVTQSLKLESEIDSALAHAEIPVSLGRASVAPMDSMTCAEVAVEMAPLVGGHVTGAKPVTDVSYQKQVVDAVAAALEQWRSDWRQ